MSVSASSLAFSCCICALRLLADHRRLFSILEFDAAGDFVLPQCVFGCAAEAHHSIRGIFEQLFCQDVFDLCGQDAFDLYGERVVIVVGIAADFMVLYVDRRVCRPHLIRGF